MSRLVLTVAVEDFWGNHLGDKEAVALALEPLGGQVRVLRVEQQEEMQISIRRTQHDRMSAHSH